MTTEWKSCIDPEELFRLKREGWEVDYFQNDRWNMWTGSAWERHWPFRIRPPQPKTKIITLRKALMLASGEVYTIDGSANYSIMPNFIRWLGEPYTVEVSDHE